MSIESGFGLFPVVRFGERDLVACFQDSAIRLKAWVPWNQVGSLTLWEAQSQLATIVLLLLVILVPKEITLAVMVTWSFIAGCVYCYLRHKGFPDILAKETLTPKECSGPKLLKWATSGVLGIFKLFLGGVQATLFTRVLGGLIENPGSNWRGNFARKVALVFTSIYFGVSTNHHVFRRAGYKGGRIWTLVLASSGINVGYRVFLSATVYGAINALNLPL